MSNGVTAQANERTWKCALYLRLSKEDGDKAESDSITNQRELVTNYIKTVPNITIVSERVDDGFSGATFQRPAFIAMMDDIRAGRVDCVAVKDLSRFGRNYTEAGRYLENVFPFMNVRFIAVNDSIDSNAKKSYGDNIIIPFKNLMNDAYCRDISVKIRSQLEVKRKNGDFIGAFAVYGYTKTIGDNKKKGLVVDEFAAEVVRDIFKWKITSLEQYFNKAAYGRDVMEQNDMYMTSKGLLSVDWSAFHWREDRKLPEDYISGPAEKLSVLGLLRGAAKTPREPKPDNPVRNKSALER